MEDNEMLRRYEELKDMVHDIKVQMQSLLDTQTFLAKQVEKLTEAMEKILPSYLRISELELQLDGLKERVRELENHKIAGKTLVNLWWKLPALATIMFGIFELAKLKIHF